MRWKRPHHTRWLLACVLAFLIATFAGGFSLRVATVFAVIFGIGSALLSLDDPEDGSAFPYPMAYPDRAGAPETPAPETPAPETPAPETPAEQAGPQPDPAADDPADKASADGLA